MKKIGIITFHTAINYGALLQAYALSYYLNNYVPSKAEIIDYSPKSSKYIKSNIVHNIRLLAFNICRHTYNIYFLASKLKKKKEFSEFRIKNVALSEKINTKSEFLNKIKDYDIIITGSDQVFNSNITTNNKDVYMLDFKTSKNQSKISYAASAGTDYIKEEEINYIKKCISDYKYVSVREESLKNNLNTNVEVVLDPVFLLSKEEWNTLVTKTKEKYIFVYLLDNNKRLINYAKELSNKTNLKIKYIFKRKVFDRNADNLYEKGPSDFLTYLSNAEYVITDSFHGLSLSIIFGKQFLVFPHETRSTRQRDLLKKLNLEERIFDSKNDINDAIDYKKVNKLLEKEITNSKAFIKEAVTDE